MSTQTDHGWVPEDTLANRLVLVRRSLGMTQRVAAEKCGLTFGEWQSLEEGRAARGLDVKVARISSALGVDRDWLIWGGPLGGGPTSEPLADGEVTPLNSLRRVTKHTHKYPTPAELVTVGYGRVSHPAGNRAA
jgi:transcriptional regulator with XRE-family HTH domain